MRVELVSADIRLLVVPAQGGRVVSLEDRRSGREWLVQDSSSDGPDAIESWAGSDAVYSGARAFGWDECLPTVARCPDPLEPMSSLLRDHGDGWGRPVDIEMVAAEPQSMAPGVRTAWSIPDRYRFERILRLDRHIIRADYRLTSLGPDLPFLWSMHPLLALDAGARLAIGRLDEVTVTSETGLDLATRGGLAGWPVAERREGGTIDLSEIQGVDASIALKAYADAPSGLVIAYQPDGSGLVIDWDRRAAPALGVWIDAGGWPVGEARHQVALEPTTAPFDDLTAALAAGRAAWVRPGRDVRWWTTMSLVGSRTAPSGR